MYLVDTNVWLERLLDQARSEEVGRFLDHIQSNQLYITDFALHSIGVILTKLNRPEVLLQFVQDILIDGATVLTHLIPEDMQRLIEVVEEYKLDFDDAYQYVAAERQGLVIVSFDGDFDKTERGRRTPANIDAAAR